MESHKLFCPGWLGTAILTISASQIIILLVFSLLFFLFPLLCLLLYRAFSLHATPPGVGMTGVIPLCPTEL
jgi:hypothetical protein